MAEKKLYEGMFLVDSARAASDWDGINAAINKILEKAGAEIVSMRKWDDRRLAYDIRGTGRGTYLLCYFRADGREIQGIEKSVQLSEKIIRVLILSTEQMAKEDVEKDTPATKSEKEKEKALAEQTQKAEVSRQSDQQESPEASAAEEAPTTEEAPAAEEAPAVEEAPTTEDVEQAKETEQAEETEKPEETEKAEEAGQAEEVEAEEPQDSQPKASSDD
jgi:small subunit ribosomal protein S6